MWDKGESGRSDFSQVYRERKQNSTVQRPLKVTPGRDA